MLKAILRGKPIRNFLLLVIILLMALHHYLSNSLNSEPEHVEKKSNILCKESELSLTSRNEDRPIYNSHQNFVRVAEIRSVMRENPPLRGAVGTHVNTANVVQHSHVWVGDKWHELSAQSRVCMATHTTVEYLFWVASQSWSGPMSIAVFAPGTDYYVAVAMIHYLRKCFPSVRGSASFHIMYPRERPPRFSNQSVTEKKLRCDDPEGVNQLLLALRNEPPLQVYPQNHNRNLAKTNCPTHYSMTIDIDMITPPSMSENLTKFFDRTDASNPCKKCAFVVPVYEVESTANYRPKDKQELTTLISNRLARRYHIKVWSPNQGNSKLDLWETEVLDREENEEEMGYRILYNITSYEKFWEPILIVPYTAPLFDERFIGYGYVRNSQVYELHRRRYKFHVLDNAFLTHRGFQSTKEYTSLRKSQIEANSIRFSSFKKELKVRMKYEAREKEART